MLLPSLGSVVHVVVAQRIFHELSCLFHHTVMSLKFSDRQIWANIVNPNQTAPDQGLLHIEKHCFLAVFGCQNVIGYASALTRT